MEYGDEQNIAIIREAKILAEINIENEVIVDGIDYTFNSRIIFDKLEMVIPEQFTEMDLEAAKNKYPSEFRPHTIFTDLSETVNITFSFLDDVEFKNEDIESMIDDLKNASKRLSPSSVFMEQKVLTNSDVNIGYYDYRGYTFSDDIYCLKFLVPIENKLMLGGFSCLWENRDKWEVLIKQMIETIRDISL